MRGGIRLVAWNSCELPGRGRSSLCSYCCVNSRNSFTSLSFRKIRGKLPPKKSSTWCIEASFQSVTQVSTIPFPLFNSDKRKLILRHFNKGSHTCGNLLKERGILITDLKISHGLLLYFATNFMRDIFPLTPRPSIKYKTCNGIIQSLTTQLFMKSNTPLAGSHMPSLLLSYEFSFE